jgi:putative ABC transport system permease protein
VEKIIGHFRMIIEEVTLAFEVLWSLAMVAAVLTLILTIAASMEERLREYAIQRILGATPKLIRTTQFLDFMLLGLLASGCALLLSELVLNGLGYFVLDTAPHFHPRTAWGVSLFGGCCITLIGLLVSHLMQGREWRLGRRY